MDHSPQSASSSSVHLATDKITNLCFTYTSEHLTLPLKPQNKNEN